MRDYHGDALWARFDKITCAWIIDDHGLVTHVPMPSGEYFKQQMLARRNTLYCIGFPTAVAIDLLRQFEKVHQRRLMQKMIEYHSALAAVIEPPFAQ